jgi:predicted transcriptional regulator
MSIVTVSVSALGEVKGRVAEALRGTKQGARISFASDELLWKTLTPKRWSLLKAMAGQGMRSRCGSGQRSHACGCRDRSHR